MKCCYCGKENVKLVTSNILSKFTIRDIKAITNVRMPINDEANVVSVCPECKHIRKYSEHYPNVENMDSMFKHFGKEKLLQYSYLVYEYKDAIKDYLVHKVEYLSKDVESYPYIYTTEINQKNSKDLLITMKQLY